MNAPKNSTNGIQNPAQVLADIDVLTDYIEGKVATFPQPFRTTQAVEMFHSLTGQLLSGLKGDEKALQLIAENLRSDIESPRVFDSGPYDKRAFARYLLKQVLKAITDRDFLTKFELYVDENRQIDSLRARFEGVLSAIANQ